MIVTLKTRAQLTGSRSSSHSDSRALAAIRFDRLHGTVTYEIDGVTLCDSAERIASRNCFSYAGTADGMDYFYLLMNGREIAAEIAAL